MLRGAAIAVVLIGTLGSALAAKGWHQTIARQRDDRTGLTAPPARGRRRSRA
jgi:hypothetical protein